MKTKKNKLLLVAIVITYISIAFSVIAMSVLLFNLYNVTDIVEDYLVNTMGVEDTSYMLTMYYMLTIQLKMALKL